jgi:hypothetical protein
VISSLVEYDHDDVPRMATASQKTFEDSLTHSSFPITSQKIEIPCVRVVLDDARGGVVHGGVGGSSKLHSNDDTSDVNFSFDLPISSSAVGRNHDGSSAVSTIDTAAESRFCDDIEAFFIREGVARHSMADLLSKVQNPYGCSADIRRAKGRTSKMILLQDPKHRFVVSSDSRGVDCISLVPSAGVAGVAGVASSRPVNRPEGVNPQALLVAKDFYQRYGESMRLIRTKNELEAYFNEVMGVLDGLEFRQVLYALARGDGLKVVSVHGEDKANLKLTWSAHDSQAGSGGRGHGRGGSRGAFVTGRGRGGVSDRSSGRGFHGASHGK